MIEYKGIVCLNFNNSEDFHLLQHIKDTLNPRVYFYRINSNIDDKGALVIIDSLFETPFQRIPLIKQQGLLNLDFWIDHYRSIKKYEKDYHNFLVFLPKIFVNEIILGELLK
jgi:hypothetical protein